MNVILDEAALVLSAWRVIEFERDAVRDVFVLRGSHYRLLRDAVLLLSKQLKHVIGDDK